MANVLITGCSSGFGLHTALLFARRGDRVFATMRTPGKAATLTQAIRDEGLPIVELALDVCDPGSVAAAMETALAVPGGLDVLVNNAGIELRSSIEDADDEDVRCQFETNVFGALRLMRAVLPAMRARRGGAIVNVSSIAGLVSRPYGGLYAATKHALEAISEALHYEVAPFGIRVVLVEPGQYGTQLLANAFPGRRFTPESPYWARSTVLDERLARLLPGGTSGDPMEVAEIIHAAVNAPEPRLRHLAGHDARMLATTYRQLAFEKYEQAVRRALDWWD